MSTTTTNLGLTQPQMSDNINVTIPGLATDLANIDNEFGLSGTTANRPTTGLYVGRRYYDTTLGRPILWNGTAWVDYSQDLQSHAINVLYPPGPLVAAKGDGTTDDTTAIQAIINWVQSNFPGGTVFFPANHTFVVGTKDANNHFLLLPPGVNIDGYGTIQVKAGVGDWRSVFEGSGTLSNQSIKNITIDANNQNNTPTTIPGGTASTIRTEIYVQSGDQITIDNVTIKNNLGVWSINLNSCTNTRVQNCKLLNMGNWTTQFDTSAVYGIGDNAWVLNNEIVASGKALTTAIERHGQNQWIQNNRVDGYQIAVIYATDTSATDKNVHITNNKFTNVMSGVQLWANNAQITDAHIVDNDIDVNNLYFSPGGVDAITTGTGSNQLIDGLTIRGNQIRYTTGLSFNAVNGPQNAGITLNTSAVSNLTIEGNTIVNPAQPGIALVISGALKNTHINNNKITNPGVSGGYYPMGLVFSNVGTFDEVYVDKNVIRDDRGTAVMTIGIASYSTVYSTDNAAKGLFVTDNVVLNPVTQAYRLDSIPTVRATVPNWTRGQGFGNGAVVGSTVYDSQLDVTYTQTATHSGTSWQAMQYKAQDTIPTSVNFTPAYGDTIINTSYDQGSPSGWRNFGGWLPMAQQGYRTNAGTPSGVVTPYYIGEFLFDSTNNVWYKSTGTVNTNWTQM